MVKSKFERNFEKLETCLNTPELREAWNIFLNFHPPTECPNSYRYRQEVLVKDIVRTCTKYGNISEKQISFLKTLLDQIDAKKKAQELYQEKSASYANCPNGKTRLMGTVVSVKLKETFTSGKVLKMFVQDETGFKAYGSVPKSLVKLGDLQPGQKVTFVANFFPSKDDPKFGFFSRPSKAELVV